MALPLDRNAVLKQLEGVADKLADSRVQGEDRLAALRRQAALGDLREALALRERRKAE